MIHLDILAGWLYMAAIAAASVALSETVVIGGKNPIEASAAAVVLGLLLRNLGGTPKRCLAGIETSEKLLILGIVLMGASLDFGAADQRGATVLAIVLFTMISSLALIYLMGKHFGLSGTLSGLLAVGTSICGGTAIAIIAPLIKAKEEEISYAIGTVALFGLIAILLYPLLGRALAVSDMQFGVFAGTAVHSTPQVVGAAYIFSEEAGKIATAVKLIRNCFIAPLALLVALYVQGRTEAGKTSLGRAFPWFLFGYFVMAICNTRGFFTPAGVAAFTAAGRYLILLGMVGVGLSTRISAFKEVGWTPLVVGLAGSIVVALQSAAMVALFL